MKRLVGFVALALLVTHASSAAAQCLPPLVPPDLRQPCRERYPSWTGELATLGTNALLGGISGAVLQKLNGGSVANGFLRGALGGAVIYAGKRVTVERFGGAGLVGRQMASVGASMVRNAGENVGTFERVMLPLGVARLYLHRSAPHVQVRADLSAIGWTVWSLTQDELGFDWSKSLSAGTPVFTAENRILVVDDDTSHAGGVVGAGVVLLTDVAPFGRDFARRTFEHERVHVVQMDQVFFTITDPVEDYVLRRIPGVRRLEPFVDLNLADYLLRWLGGRIPRHLERPWETEAIFLSR